MITKTRISVLAMLAIAGLSIAYIVSVGLNVTTSSGRQATMTVPDTNGLLVGSRVLLRGIEVGHVTAIDQAPSGVEVTLNYSQDTEVPVDSVFRVDNLSALGEAYVAVMPTKAGGPYLTDHARIDDARVSVPTTFKELSERLATVLDEVDPDAVDRVFTELDRGLPDETSVINELGHAGTLFSAEITRESDSLVTLLSTLQPLIMRSGTIPDVLREATGKMYGFGDGFRLLLASVRDAVVLGGPLYDGVKYGASPLFAELQKFLDENAAELNVIGVNLMPAARAGAASLRTVDLGRVLGNLAADSNPKGALTVHIPAGG